MKRPALLLALLAACAGGQKQDATALLREAQADLAAGRSDKAQREFEDLLARDPRELAAIRGRIEAARKRGALEPLLREMSQRSELRKAGERNDGTGTRWSSTRSASPSSRPATRRRR